MLIAVTQNEFTEVRFYGKPNVSIDEYNKEVARRDINSLAKSGARRVVEFQKKAICH